MQKRQQIPREYRSHPNFSEVWQVGGDAYTAVAVAKKIGTGSWVVYNIFRDHLGTITHLKNGSTIDEYSYDAWGRRRDKDNWSYTLSGEPALFADRGFTSHEFLSDFNLYNMNGRLYDPVLGRFLSPDPYIADPSFTQSYNRYSYVLNNPLKYNDPTGEFPWLAAGIFAAYMYLNNAYANLNQSTGKWAWNPTTWFGKGSNTTVQFGVKTNSDFSDVTAFMGIGVGSSIPAFAVNTNSGVGFGVNTPQGTDFVYPGAKQPSEQSIANEAIGQARMKFTGYRGNNYYFEGVRVRELNFGNFKYGAAMTVPGIGIFVGPGGINDVDLLKHEFGHILQYQKWGAKVFWGDVAPSSLRFANYGNKNSHYTQLDYMSNWTEWSANYLSYKYFEGDFNTTFYPISPVNRGKGINNFPPFVNGPIDFYFNWLGY